MEVPSLLGITDLQLRIVVALSLAAHQAHAPALCLSLLGLLGKVSHFETAAYDLCLLVVSLVNLHRTAMCLIHCFATILNPKS